MIRRWARLGCLALSGLVAGACTRSTEDTSNGGGGSGGSSDAAQPEAGPPRQRDAAARDATSAAADAAESALDGCRVPPDATALCLTFLPERVAPRDEPGLDQRGFLTLEVFDTPSPPAGKARSAAALYRRTVPVDSDSGGEIALTDLPEPTVLLNDGLSEVYLLAQFFDNARVSGDVNISWGTWLGGLDLRNGLSEDLSLSPIPLVTGGVTRHQVALTALRRLTVTVTASVAPLGDGEGGLSVVASRLEGLPPRVPTDGYGIDPCVDMTRGPQTVEVGLIGSGSFFVTAFFDDLGIETPGEMPPGTLLSVGDFDPGTARGTYDQVTLADDQYAAELSVDLGTVIDLRGDPTALGPNSCADLGLPGAP